MKTITKLLVQLEVTKAHREFRHVNSEAFRQQVERSRTRDVNRSKSVPYQLGKFINIRLIHINTARIGAGGV